ncbi:DNA/RNA helicase, DEAD/DEAH box type containing protein [Cricetulus griseus]|uniref:DNA/RNA helicase, DEAD/DEAH box type containing protein n=1 Tax=Cricetulus griseus TaxID=10029 RepID=A0A061I4V7_CRIGR|nr:DNA/RNA helicase, DEAD/DEAH box type containing protein [Cricetulus griseus]
MYISRTTVRERGKSSDWSDLSLVGICHLPVGFPASLLHPEVREAIWQLSVMFQQGKAFPFADSSFVVNVGRPQSCNTLHMSTGLSGPLGITNDGVLAANANSSDALCGPSKTWIWTELNQRASSLQKPSGDEEGRDTEMMQQDTAPVPEPSQETKQPMECFLTQAKETKEETRKTKKWKKKKISEILAKSEPKPGTPGDLQQLIKDHYSGSRSVIELEELNLPDSCFLKANDLTHSLSSYLKEICPKWVKLRKTHSEKKSVLMLIMCSSAVRALELIRSLTAFKGDAKVMKLFAKHIKVREQVKFLENRVIHLGVGTPGRIKELVKQDGLNLNPLKFLVFDWNWRDQKLRRMMDIPEIRKEVFELLDMGVFSLCKSESLKLGLF